MSHLSFIHLSGMRRGETDTLGAPLPAAIGSDPTCAVMVPGVAARHASLAQRDGEIVLLDAGSGLGTLLAGEQIEEAVLRDGDIVELGAGGPKLRFRHEGAERVGLLRTLAWARPESAPDRLGDSAAFARALWQEASRRTSPTFKVLVVGTLVLGAALLVWSQVQARRLEQELVALREAVRRSDEERARFQARVEAERERAAAERRALEDDVAAARRQEHELRERLQAATSGEVQSLKTELAVTRERLASLEAERAAAARIIRDYGAGVCLVQGSYAFHDASGRALRYETDASGAPVAGSDGSVSLSLEGRGAVHTVDYFGTGFLVSRDGRVLTNRHVAEPWWKDAGADSLVSEGLRPTFVSLRAFFPREAEAFELRFETRDEQHDLAVLRVDLKGRRIPVLPLDRTGRTSTPGQPVVVLGYPTGLEAILAKADASVVKTILEAHGQSAERVTEALSRKGLIRPSATQGHIGDVTGSDLVFDAPTTQGGSGGPIFNLSGVVIAVEYAVLSRFGGNAFGVPVRYAVELLRDKPARPKAE